MRQRGAMKPDQLGATSGMWINGAGPQTGEQPLVTSEKVSECNDTQMTQQMLLQGDFHDNQSGCGDFQPQVAECDTWLLELVFVFPGQAGCHPATTHVVEHNTLSHEAFVHV